MVKKIEYIAGSVLLLCPLTFIKTPEGWRVYVAVWFSTLALFIFTICTPMTLQGLSVAPWMCIFIWLKCHCRVSLTRIETGRPLIARIMCIFLH